MSDFRTKRCRKQVDYSKFALGEDDDDFADSTPPTKKAKKSQALKPNKPKVEVKKVESRIKNDRKHAAERKFEEELQLALSRSMSNQDDQQQAQCDTISSTPDSQHGPGGESFLVTADVQSDVSGIKQIDPTPAGREERLCASSSVRTAGLEQAADVIQVIDEDLVVFDRTGSCRQKRQAAAKAAKQWTTDDEDDPFSSVSSKAKKRKTDDDSVYHGSDAVSLETPSDSEDDWDASDSDCDFGGRSSKKNTKRKKDVKVTTSKKKTTTISKPNTISIDDTELISKNSKERVTPITSTPLPKVVKPLASKTTVPKENKVIHTPSNQFVSVSKTTDSSSDGPKKALGCGMPRKSPSLVSSVGSRTSSGGGACVASPSGGLRLGLSKKARIKPLHASVNIVH